MMTRHTQQRKKLIEAWFIFPISLVFLALGMYVAVNALSFLPGTISTSGSVRDCKGSPNRACQPTVHFQTKTGQQITFLAPFMDISNYSIGDTVSVQYHPDSPQDGRAISGHTWILSLFLIGFGLLGLFMSLETILRRTQTRNSTP